MFHGIPYPGLKVFGPEDGRCFTAGAGAGGAQGVLRTQAGRNCAFLLIFGMSGSGKSSLVRAGLVHALAATPGWIEGVDTWRWCVVRPGDATGDQLDALAQAIFGDTALREVRAGTIDGARLAGTARQPGRRRPDPRACALRGRRFGRECCAADRPLTGRLLVAVDQMEELFTGDQLGHQDRERYVAALAARCAERARMGGRHHAQRVLRAVPSSPSW